MVGNLEPPLADCTVIPSKSQGSKVDLEVGQLSS